MIVLDTSFLFALLDRSEPDHEVAAEWYRRADHESGTTPLVVGEMDYLTESRSGRLARTRFRRDVQRGSYLVAWWPEAADQSVRIAERYRDLGVSLTDASLVALASRLGTTAIATFDERHFRAMQPLSHGTSFTVLPADA